MNWVAKVTSAFLLTFFLGAMFFSLFHLSMGMEMSGGMTGCPFASHEEVVCSMNLVDHIGAWKSVFLAVSPTVLLLSSIVGTAFLIVSVAPNLLQRIRYLCLLTHAFKTEIRHACSARSLQELFSNGILHPKLF